jgi:hypothetical protein
MGMHRVIAQVLALQWVVIVQHWSMMHVMLFFYEVYWYGIKGLQHLKIREGDGIYEKLTFGKLFWNWKNKNLKDDTKKKEKVSCIFAFLTNSSSISPLRPMRCSNFTIHQFLKILPHA